MTVPLECAPEAGPMLKDATAPRKRRRRAPASGAADDCFTCHKRNVKCDRRRPYCSPCLEIGSECSGYKTQLTWGVGVASRGKLRGLSLPVAKSAPAPKSPGIGRTENKRLVAPKMPLNRTVSVDDVNARMRRMPLPAAPPTYTNYDFVNMNAKSPGIMEAGASGSDWGVSADHLTMRQTPPVDTHSHGQLLRQSLRRLQTPSFAYGDDLLSASAGSISAYSDGGYSPMAHIDESPYLASPMPLHDGYFHASPADQSHLFSMSADSRGPTSCPDQFYSTSDMSSSAHSHPTMFDIADAYVPSQIGQSAMSETDYEDELMKLSNSQSSEHFMNQIQSGEQPQIIMPGEPFLQQQVEMGRISESLNAGLSSDVSPRLDFYLNYYEKIICPITVAIDSPSNPYRREIFSLAAESKSLQHAICALASCNLRMRRKNSLILESWGWDGSDSSDASKDPSKTHHDDATRREEYHHRTLAVSLLNAQLSDPSQAKHDSVLATLLMLCHYRMCETGIAQFKTQFAGVKKLMGMRNAGPSTSTAGCNWGWMETAFTFFDAITASVNDREAQLRGGYLDMAASPYAPAYALENLAGCDSRLFKIIAVLGRLNLLSQGRQVLSPLPGSSEHAASLRNPPAQAQPALNEYYRQYAGQFGTTLNAAGWPTSPTPSPPLPSNNSSSSTDDSTQFWNEWRSTRQALQAWTFSPASLLTSLAPVVPSPSQIRDFGFVSEAFRHAALLYTERLATPGLPSADLRFQSHVGQVLFYVTQLGGEQGEVGSEAMGKFLLWPLFVAGSEAVGEYERGVVRERCRGITRRGGYANNLAGLQILEKLWREGDEAVVSGKSVVGDGENHFRWKRFMREVEGEYIMV